MVNINDDTDAAYAEAKHFLDTYYMTDTTPDRMEAWVSYGAPDRVAHRLQAYVDAGVRTLIVRFASWEPITQIRRAIDQVLPRVRTDAEPLA